jgi:hypothetical protein
MARSRNRQHSKKLKPSRPKRRRLLLRVQRWVGQRYVRRALSVFRILGAAVGVVALLLGLADAATTFMAKVSVSPSTQPDQRRPQSSICILKNDSVLPIYSVDFRFRWKALRYVNNEGVFQNQWFEVQDRSGDTALPGVRIGRLAASQETTVQCSFVPGWEIFEKSMKLGEVGEATLLIDVSYKSFLLWRETKHFRFRASRDVNGNFDWVPETDSRVYQRSQTPPLK